MNGARSLVRPNWEAEAKLHQWTYLLGFLLACWWVFVFGVRWMFQLHPAGLLGVVLASVAGIGALAACYLGRPILTRLLLISSLLIAPVALTAGSAFKLAAALVVLWGALTYALERGRRKLDRQSDDYSLLAQLDREEEEELAQEPSATATSSTAPPAPQQAPSSVQPDAPITPTSRGPNRWAQMAAQREAAQEEPEQGPLMVPTPELLERLRNAEGELGKRVIGQEEAVEAVAHALRRAAAKIGDPDRPLGSFLCLGPTGVGKTELARTLADFLYSDPKAMVRLDMSEFYDRHTVANLIGAPRGYIGSDEEGKLTGPVRKRPQSVILLDEIEKAHPGVLDILLQVLDDARLTDSFGGTVDFHHTIIIVTSNLRGEELERWMRPELRNRFDEIVHFHPLTHEHLEQIIGVQLERLTGRLTDRPIHLTLTPAAKTEIIGAGFDPEFGARPLKRAIQRLVENPLAELIVAGELEDGDAVHGDVSDTPGELVFTVEKSGATSAGPAAA